MRAIIPALVLAFLAGPALAHMPGGLEVVGAWTRPAAAGMTGAGYMTVRNHGKQPQTLVRIESPAARKVEMHRSVVAGGVARMEAVPQLTIAPGAEARFAPGGMHLMLVGLVKAQAAGQRIPATLVFASGARVKGDMIVGGAAPPEKGGSTHNH